MKTITKMDEQDEREALMTDVVWAKGVKAMKSMSGGRTDEVFWFAIFSVRK